MWWIEKLFTILLVLGFNITLTSAGLYLVDLLKLEVSKLIRLVIGFGFGSAVFGTLTFFVGYLFGLNFASFLALYVILLAFASLKAKSLYETTKFKIPRMQEFDIVFVVIQLLLVIYMLYRGVLPDIGFDAIWYHLTLPKLYLMNGEISFIGGDHLYYSAMPQLVEGLYVHGLAISGDIAAKLIHTFFTFWAGIFAFAWAIERTKKFTGGIIASLLFTSLAVVLWEASTAYIDTALAFYVSIGLYFYFEYIKSKSKYSLLVAASLFIGFGIATKYFVLFLWAILTFTHLVNYLLERYPLKRLLIELSILVGIPLLIWLPWIAFSYLSTGNPVYPVADTLFNKNSEISKGNVYGDPTNGGSKYSWFVAKTKQLFEMPVRMFQIDYGFSPILMFGFVGATVAYIKKRKYLLFGIIWILFFIVWNYALNVRTRYFEQMVIVMSVFTAPLLIKITKDRLSRALLTLVIAWNAGYGLFFMHNLFEMHIWPYNQASEDAYKKSLISDNVYNIYDFDGTIKDIVGNSKVLTFQVENLFYLDFNFEDDSYSYLREELFGDKEKIENHLKENYEFIVSKLIDEKRIATAMELDEFSNDLLEQVYADRQTQVYIYQINK